MIASTHPRTSRTETLGADSRPLHVAVVGSGIAGMAAAWLLSRRHLVTVFEDEARLGGHTNTVTVPTPAGEVAVDTGFIVYNEVSYPNLVALFAHLGVPTQASDMSFSVSLDDGAFEYAGSSLSTLFAQRRNLVRPRVWTMLRDIRRFYREAPAILDEPEAADLTLGAYLARGRYSTAFVDDHLLPMAAAIWSAPPAVMLDHPALAFVQFCRNHGLLQIAGRPQWRTVSGGSREYVRRLTASVIDHVRLGDGVRRIRRLDDGVLIASHSGAINRFDHVVIATHADQALAMLEDPTVEERGLLGAFGYQRNDAILHGDPALMPKCREAWASWNYLGRSSAAGREIGVTYWMNRLQSLPDAVPLFVSLNPAVPPDPSSVLASFVYEHPVFSVAALHAQKRLWRLQGQRRTWYCGAYFGAGFHEDGLQAGLWAAEALGGVRRPWTVANESSRIFTAQSGALEKVS
jgi:uncharacterized protein